MIVSDRHRMSHLTVPHPTPEERRKRARLASLRWRWAHGIMPRKPAHRPWLAEGISRSNVYRRCAKARQEAAQQAALVRAEDLVHQLTRDLARADICNRKMMGIIAELATVHAGGGQRLLP